MTAAMFLAFILFLILSFPVAIAVRMAILRQVSWPSTSASGLRSA